jgi:hypothetical protein
MFEFSSSRDIAACLFGGQFGGVSFPKVPNPLAGIVITKIGTPKPAIWGAPDRTPIAEAVITKIEVPYLDDNEKHTRPAA